MGVAKLFFNDFSNEEFNLLLDMEIKFKESLEKKLNLDDNAFKQLIPGNLLSQQLVSSFEKTQVCPPTEDLFSA